MPIFRPWPDQGTDDPNSLAAYVLVPWSNRISGGGFHFGGRFHPLEPNFPPEPFPLHGNGWTSEWTLVEAAADRLSLELASEGPGPFRYLAKLTYELTPARSVRLSVTNRAAMRFPLGSVFTLGCPARRIRDCWRRRRRSGWRSGAPSDPQDCPRERPEWNFDCRVACPTAGSTMASTAGTGPRRSNGRRVASRSRSRLRTGWDLHSLFARAGLAVLLLRACLACRGRAQSARRSRGQRPRHPCRG